MTEVRNIIPKDPELIADYSDEWLRISWAAAHIMNGQGKAINQATLNRNISRGKITGLRVAPTLTLVRRDEMAQFTPGLAPAWLRD